MSQNSKLFAPRCEINVVSHCNMACRSCSHLSPVTPKSFIQVSSVERDVDILTKYYHVKHVLLLGGEPLLHPELSDIAHVIRASDICDHIRVVTNGTLLWKMDDYFWESVDEVYISMYPGHIIKEDHLEIIKQNALKHNTTIKIYKFNNFRVSYSEKGTSDLSLVGRIYSTCQVAHIWQCSTLHDGYLYKCPQSLFLNQLLSRDSLPTGIDGVKIVDDLSFKETLNAYMQSPDPLHRCRYCLGSVGKLFRHMEIPRRDWRGFQDYTSEDLIDMDYLNILENLDAEAANSCFEPEVLDLIG